MFSEKHKKGNTERGAVLVLVAIGIFFILGLAALVIDLGFLFVTRNQLHVAADSGSLAGATKIVDPNDCGNSTLASNYPARVEAQKFAKFNKSASKDAPSDVILDLNITNEYVPGDVIDSSDGDIVLGNFTRNRVPEFIDCDGVGGTPVNAVRVHARRNSDSGTGIDASNAPVTTFFASALNFKTAAVHELATAINAGRAAIPVCVPHCVKCTPGPFIMNTNDKNAAWTVFNEKSNGSPIIQGFIDNPFSVPCGAAGLDTINVKQGEDGASMKKLLDAYMANAIPQPAVRGTSIWPVTLPVCAFNDGTCPVSGPYSGAQPLDEFVTFNIKDVIKSGENKANPPSNPTPPCGPGTNPGKSCIVGEFDCGTVLEAGQCSKLVE